MPPELSRRRKFRCAWYEFSRALRGPTTLSALVRRKASLFGSRCQKCGSLENLQVHHMIRRSQQGDDAVANLLTLCAHCHMAEHGQLFCSIPAIRVCGKPEPRRK